MRLNPFDSFGEHRPPREYVEEQFRVANKALELRDSKLFQWWRAQLVEGVKEDLSKLARSDGTDRQIGRRQGKILMVEAIFKRLDALADSVETLNERLKEYDVR